MCEPEESPEHHKQMIEAAEMYYQSLGIPYRVVNICSGELNNAAAIKHDLEGWFPTLARYRELVSCSNCTDYQARRLNLRWREAPSKPTQGFVHTLNNTALATSRTMIGIIEQFQQKDGTVMIPKVLRPFMDGMETLGKK